MYVVSFETDVSQAVVPVLMLGINTQFCFVGSNNYGIIQNTVAPSNAVRDIFIIITQDYRIRGDNQTLHKKWSFYIKDFLSKCDQIRRKLRIWSHLLKKSLMENFNFCTVKITFPYDKFYSSFNWLDLMVI